MSNQKKVVKKVVVNQKSREQAKGFTLRNSIVYAARTGAPIKALKRSAEKLFINPEGKYTVNPHGAFPVNATTRQEFMSI